MADVTGEEFRTFMTILSSLKVMGSAHQDLADIVGEQAELSQPFQVNLYFIFWSKIWVLYLIKPNLTWWYRFEIKYHYNMITCRLKGFCIINAYLRHYLFLNVDPFNPTTV